MFDQTSRYARVPTATVVLPDGREVTVARRRLVPPGASLRLLAEVVVGPGERPDLLAARTLGDPTQFWRLADANDAMDPSELTAVPGRVVRVPEPQP
jgi:hypothetical protein